MYCSGSHIFDWRNTVENVDNVTGHECGSVSEVTQRGLGREAG